MNRSLLVLLCSFVLFVSCNKKDTAVPEQKITNVSYGPDERNKMDVYLPANRNASTPFVIFIHGGSWTNGDKEEFRFLQDTLLNRGVGSAFINYRYASATVHYEDLMKDVDAAVSYCINHKNDYKIRDNNIVMAGHSAGAHMAMLYSYRYDKPGKVGAVISYAGPCDLTDPTNLFSLEILELKQSVEYFVGAPYIAGEQLDPKYEDASPLFHVKNIPTLMLYGDKDPIAIYRLQAVPLESKFSSLGYVHKLVTMEGAGHDLGFAKTENMQRIVNESITWITTYSN